VFYWVAESVMLVAAGEEAEGERKREGCGERGTYLSVQSMPRRTQVTNRAGASGPQPTDGDLQRETAAPHSGA
jgi:hypothetical protein